MKTQEEKTGIAPPPWTTVVRVVMTLSLLAQGSCSLIWRDRVPPYVPGDAPECTPGKGLPALDLLGGLGLLGTGVSAAVSPQLAGSKPGIDAAPKDQLSNTAVVGGLGTLLLVSSVLGFLRDSACVEAKEAHAIWYSTEWPKQQRLIQEQRDGRGHADAVTPLTHAAGQQALIWER